MKALPRVRWHQEIRVRLALIVAATMLGSMLIAYNAEGWASVRFAGNYDILDDEDFRLDEVGADGVARDELGRPRISQSEWERIGRRIDRLIGVALGLGGALISLGVGWIVSRRVTQPVRDLAIAVQDPVAEGRALPGPFDDRRRDELGVLAAALNTMRARIRTLVEELAERDRARRHWVALVSHDLRNPLQALTACIDRAAAEARQLPEGAPREAMQRLLGTARLDVDRFEVLTADLLELARLDADDSLTLEPVPPGELARSAAHGMRILAEANGRALDVRVEPGGRELLADGRRMLRALENLLRNAIQHAALQITLTVEPAKDGAAVRFRVADDGAGLPTLPDGSVDVARLGAYKSRDDSAGLGLVVARRVAEAHGGRIGAFNRAADGADPGGGAVWIEIPCRLPAHAEEPLEEEEEDEE